VILLHALIAVIRAILQTAASALVAGFSLLILVLIALAVLAALIVTLAGGLGMGGVHWLRRRSRDRRNPNSHDDPHCR
jgi:membrane protein implicated in regulation of membrane protease activity